MVSESMTGIAHLTSAHPRDDTRVFLKECRGLANQGFETVLIVADGKGDEHFEGVEIYDVGSAKGRITRVFKATRKIYKRAAALDVELYHLHDPELLLIAPWLRRQGKRVIFDAHEDLPKQILHKDYIFSVVGRVLSLLIERFELFVCRRYLDGIVAATPSILAKFLKICPKCVGVNNFPIIGELDGPSSWDTKSEEVSYVGYINEARGIGEVVDAMAMVRPGITLNLGGVFSEQSTRDEMTRRPGWSRTNELGFIDRHEMRETLARSVAGLITFHALPNHVEAQPNKIFEYMSSGIPVIASDFPLWREIVEGNSCGICVDPQQPAEIARAIETLVGDPEAARRMGNNGRRAVRERYNWATEEARLVGFYADLGVRPHCEEND
jgi:glycosyltransferase involved in cell wall biosynthesis